MARSVYSAMLVLLSFTVVNVDAAAQDMDENLLPGTRVRIWSPDIPKGLLEGSLIFMNQDTIVVQAKDPRTDLHGPYAAPIDRVLRIEMDAGYYSDHARTVRFMQYGGGGGFVIGALIGLGLAEDLSDSGTRRAPSTKREGINVKNVFLGSLIVGAAGALIGAAIGAIPIHHWKKVDMTHLHIGVMPYSYDKRWFLSLSWQF